MGSVQVNIRFTQTLILLDCLGCTFVLFSHPVFLEEERAELGVKLHHVCVRGSFLMAGSFRAKDIAHGLCSNGILIK